MRPWACAQIADRVYDQFAGRRVSIRAAIAFATIRKQIGFSKASNYQIRKAVWRYAKELDFSITPNPFGGRVSADLASEWSADVKRWSKEGLPIPDYMYPRLVLRFLNEERLAGAAHSLSFVCPFCTVAEEAHVHGGWLMDGQMIVCGPCGELRRQALALAGARTEGNRQKALHRARQEVRAIGRSLNDLSETINARHGGTTQKGGRPLARVRGGEVVGTGRANAHRVRPDSTRYAEGRNRRSASEHSVHSPRRNDIKRAGAAIETGDAQSRLAAGIRAPISNEVGA